jgi:hypothetical protein
MFTRIIIGVYLMVVHLICVCLIRTTSAYRAVFSPTRKRPGIVGSTYWSKRLVCVVGSSVDGLILHSG